MIIFINFNVKQIKENKSGFLKKFKNGPTKVKPIFYEKITCNIMPLKAES